VATAPAYTYTPVITAPSPPPPARTEIIPPSPNPQVVWQPGFWTLNAGSWVWVPGHYEARPQPTAQWVPGHWGQQTDGTWVWVAGFWTS